MIDLNQTINEALAEDRKSIYRSHLYKKEAEKLIGEILTVVRTVDDESKIKRWGQKRGGRYGDQIADIFWLKNVYHGEFRNRIETLRDLIFEEVPTLRQSQKAELPYMTTAEDDSAAVKGDMNAIVNTIAFWASEL